MFQRGDWVVPMFNGQMFPEKPPLMFWTMMAGFELFGVNEWGARIFSAVLGVGTALCAFHLGRILANARVGLWAGLITASTLIFTVSARAATVDSALTFVTTLAFLMFAVGWKRAARSGLPVQGSGFEGAGNAYPALYNPGPENSNPDPKTPDPKSAGNALWLPYAIVMYACVGLAVLAKGPVGMLLPLAAMGLFLLVANGWRKLFWSARWMRPWTALLVVAAVAVPWYVWVGVRTHGEWLRVFIVEFNLRPFRQPILSHGDVSSFDFAMAALVSILYYFYQIPAILCGFFPWAVFLGPTLVETVRRLRRRDAWWDGCALASCWFGVWFVFWSICKTKLPHYLLPAYPALALLTALFIDRWQSGEKGTGPICRNGPEGALHKLDLSPFPRWWLRNAWISMILVGVGMMIALPIVAAIFLPGETVLGLVGLIPVIGGGWCWWKTAHDQHAEAVIACRHGRRLSDGHFRFCRSAG
jgi:4-amino-4-deoxy-L-arabinose transferase-like glycosyltransferase